MNEIGYESLIDWRSSVIYWKNKGKMPSPYIEIEA